MSQILCCDLVCASNLKQSGLALFMYAQDNNNLAFLYKSWSPGPEQGWADPLKSGEYIKDMNTSLCLFWTPNKYTSNTTTYGMEYWFMNTPAFPIIKNSSDNIHFRNLSKIDSPTKRISLADSVYGLTSSYYPNKSGSFT